MNLAAKALLLSSATKSGTSLTSEPQVLLFFSCIDYNRNLDSRCAYHLHGKPGNSGWKIKIMVHIIPFGVLRKLWASGQSDAFLLLLLGFTADVHTFCMLSIFC